MRLYLWRRTPTSNYVIRGTDSQGREVHQSTKTISKTAAEALRVKLEGRMLTESIHGKKAVVTFDQAVESYLATGGSPRYIGYYDEKTGRWSGMMAYLFGRELRSIDQAYCDEITRKLYPACQPQTINRQFWGPFIAVWRHAVRREWADLKLWQRAKKQKGTIILNAKPPKVGSYPVDYDTAWNFIHGMGVANQCLMTILFYTGMRPIELFAMGTKQVNVPGRWITIPRSKIGEGRGVPIHEALVPMLTDLVENRPGRLILTWDKKPYTLSDERGTQIHRAITAARLRTHVFDVAPYTGRHTVSTQLVVNGIHPYIKDQILGHAVSDMSRNYVNVPQPKLVESINTLPTIPAWADQDWMSSPVTFWSRRHKSMSRIEMDAGEKAQIAWNDERRVA